MRSAVLILLLATSLNGWAQSLFTNVFSFVNSSGVTQNVKQVSIEPLQALGVYGNSVVVTNALIFTVKTNTLPVALLNGYSYRVKYFASVSPEVIGSTFTNYFSTNVSGVVNAASYVTISTNLGNGIYAYSMAQADARFALSGAIPSGVVTNNQTGVTLTGTFSGSGLGLTNVSAYNPSYNAGAPQAVATVGLQGQFTETRNLSYFYGTGDNMAALPNSAVNAVTNLSVTFAGSTTGNVSVANNVATLTIGSSNAVANTQTNFPFSAMANVLQSQVTTNSLLGNPNSAHWSGTGGTYFTATAFKNGGEYIFNQQSNSLGNGLAYNFAMPPGITNLSVSFSMRSLNGPGSLYVQFDENNNNIAQRQISLVTNAYTNLTFTTTASDFLSNATNCSLKFLVGAFPFCVSNFVFTVQTAQNDPLFSGNWKRIEVRPRNVVSGNFISSYVSDKQGSAPIWAENVTAASCGNKAYTEFYTDAANVKCELSIVNNRVNGSAYPNTVYVNGAFYTNIITPVNYQNSYTMTNLYLGNEGVTKTVRVYNSEGESSSFPNYLRAVLLPTTNLFGFTRSQTTRKIFVVGDSIMAGNRTYGDQSQDIWGIVGDYMDVEIVRNTLGGASLNKLWQTNATKKAFLHAINIAKPDALWVALGVNDKANNYYGNGTNGFQQDYSNLLATVHYQFPALPIYAQNLLYTTDGTATGGYTISQYRDAITAEATRAANWTVLLDASTWLTAADLEDNYHPSLLASGKLAMPIVANLVTNNLVVRP